MAGCHSCRSVERNTALGSCGGRCDAAENAAPLRHSHGRSPVRIACQYQVWPGSRRWLPSASSIGLARVRGAQCCRAVRRGVGAEVMSNCLGGDPGWPIRWRPPATGASVCAGALHHESQAIQVGRNVTTCERCVCARWRASPSGAGDSGWPQRDDMQAVGVCALERFTMSCGNRGDAARSGRGRRDIAVRVEGEFRAPEACATTSGSRANPYQCLVPGLFPSIDASDLACPAVAEPLVSIDHPGVQIKS